MRPLRNARRQELSEMLTRNPDDELLARLIDAIGKSDVAAAERIRFEDAFKRLKRNYQERLPAFEADVDHRALLRKLLANTRKRRELRRQLAAVQQEIRRVGWIRIMDAKFPEPVQLRMAEFLDPIALENIERLEENNIKYFLKTTDDYRKGALRRLLIEPFLSRVLRENVTFSRERPLTGAMDALFDYIGVAPNRRPDKSGIRTIARDIKSSLKKQPG